MWLKHAFIYRVQTCVGGGGGGGGGGVVGGGTNVSMGGGGGGGGIIFQFQDMSYLQNRNSHTLKVRVCIETGLWSSVNTNDDSENDVVCAKNPIILSAI